MATYTQLSAAHLRVARPTNDLGAVTRFYREGLGFEQLYGFRDHAGFDGVMLGHPGAAYHLEFTRRAGHDAGRAPGQDMLVFYLPDPDEWRCAVDRLEAAGYAAVAAFNQYWDRQGRTFEDPDGYRVVLQNAAWPATQGACIKRRAMTTVICTRSRAQRRPASNAAWPGRSPATSRRTWSALRWRA